MWVLPFVVAGAPTRPQSAQNPPAAHYLLSPPTLLNPSPSCADLFTSSLRHLFATFLHVALLPLYLIASFLHTLSTLDRSQSLFCWADSATLPPWPLYHYSSLLPHVCSSCNINILVVARPPLRKRLQKRDFFKLLPLEKSNCRYYSYTKMPLITPPPQKKKKIKKK